MNDNPTRTIRRWLPIIWLLALMAYRGDEDEVDQRRSRSSAPLHNDIFCRDALLHIRFFQPEIAQTGGLLDDARPIVLIWALTMIGTTWLLTPLEWQRYYVPVYPALGLLAALGVQFMMRFLIRFLSDAALPGSRSRS